MAAWVAMGKKVNPRYAKMASIKLKTVLDSMKALQLHLDSIMRGRLFDGTYDIKGPNEVHVTFNRWVSLEGLERNWPERIVPLCRKLEKIMIEVYAINPRFEAVPLKLPPRKSQDDIACEWGFKIGGIPIKF